MATPYYDDPNSPGYDSGVGQLKRARARSIEDRAVIENPVGPPALVRPPPVNNAVSAGVRVNPSATDLAGEGALRPAAGAFSASNPQPTVDAGGNLTTPAPIARPTPTLAPTNPAARAATEIAAAAPVLATVTPATAANASDLALTRPGAVRAGGSTTAPQATSVNGRPLGYGAEVNGVRVFSDGSGGANAPARTMTDAQVAGLANGNRISVADSGVGGNISGEAAGGLTRPGSAAAGVLAGTPELGSADGLALVRPRAGAVDPAAAARANQATAEANAASDLASIATRDGRSVLGRAARTAAIDANSSFGTPTSRRLAYDATLTGLNAKVGGDLKSAGDLTRATLEDQGATRRAGINADASIAGDLLRNRPTPTQVPLADGTLGLLGPDGVIRPARDAAGKPVRGLQTKDDATTKRTAELEDAMSKTASTLLAGSTLGAAATPEQIGQARLQAAQLHGFPTATGPNGQKIVQINGEWKPL